MNNNAKAWIAALRSGKYKQGRRKLRQDDTFCCLGVACELAVEAGVDIKRTSDSYGYSYDGEFAVLPHKVQEWLGLQSPVGDLYEDNVRVSSLAVLNDHYGKSFNEIAQIIEDTPNLFKKDLI